MSQFFQTREETAAWLDQMGVEKYTINEDLTVDVAGSVDISGKGLTAIPVRFGMVEGWFNCSNNDLRTLEGAPRQMAYFFETGPSEFKPLEGAPKVEVEPYRVNEMTAWGSVPDFTKVDLPAPSELKPLEGAPKVESIPYSVNDMTSGIEPYFIAKERFLFNCDGNNSLRDVGAWRDHHGGFRGPSAEEVTRNKIIYERDLLSKVAEQNTIERPANPKRSRVM